MHKAKAREVQKSKIWNLHSILKKEEVKNTILDFDKYNCIDIGAICFLDRAPLKQGRFPVNGRTVNPDSIDKSRIDCIYKYIISISKKLASDGGALREIHKNTNELVRYVEWCDFRGYENALADGRHAAKYAEEYAIYQSISGNKTQISAFEASNRVFNTLKHMWTCDELELRRIRKYDAFANIDEIITRPWEAVAMFGSRCSADIGSLCYRNGDSVDKRLPNSGRWVDINSFDADRVEPVIKLIKLISGVKEKSKKTIQLEIAEFIRFIVWCDASSLCNPFNGIDDAKQCLKLYKVSLSELISSGRIEMRVALKRERASVLWLSKYFDIDEFRKDLALQGQMEQRLGRIALSKKHSETYLLDFIGHLLKKFSSNKNDNSHVLEIKDETVLLNFQELLINKFHKSWNRRKEMPKKLKSLSVFLRWADSSGFHSLFTSQECAKKAFDSFGAYLGCQVDSQKIMPSTKIQYLNAITQLMGEAFKVGNCLLRPTTVIDLMKDIDPLALIHTEGVILKFSDSKKLDIGCRAFINRSRDQDSINGSGWTIDYESINLVRVAQLKRLILLIAEQFKHSGRRPETMHDLVKRFLTMVDWADKNQHGNLMVDINYAKDAAKHYVKFIRDRVSLGEITLNSGARQQAALTLLGDYFEDENFKRGLNLLYPDAASRQSTPPVDRGAIQRVVTLCDYLFNGFCDLVLGPAKYPHKIVMPEYLGWQANEMYLFPSSPMFLTPFQIENRGILLKPGLTQNYKEGRLSSFDELMTMGAYSCSSHEITKAIESAQDCLSYANNNHKNKFNLKIAIRSVNIFLILFSAQTGINWSQVINQEWVEDYEESLDLKGFRGIKPRAGNREVAFYLPVQFMPTFRRFLELRKYLLNEGNYKYLFFDFGADFESMSPQKIKQFLDSTFAFMRRIDPGLPMIKSRQWRASKSDYLLRNTDVETTAIILQNSVDTVLASYSEGQESSQIQEMTQFLNGVSSALVIGRSDASGITELPIGACIADGNPQKNIGDGNVVPDCKKIEGCFFCDKYRVHADDIDVRKLVSCRHFLMKVSNSFSSFEEFHASSAPYLTQIEKVLSSISEINPVIVDIVAIEVEVEGELDPYWQKKLEMFMELSN